MSLNIIKGIDNYIDHDKKVVVTIGTFDGLHLGHQEIIKHLMQSSEDGNYEPLAVTFEPHPRVLVTPHEPPPLLTTWDEKIKLFSMYMKGQLLVLEFTRELMNKTAEIFVKNYLIKKINLKKLIVGYDHAFGKNRSGTINDLMELSRKYSFDLEVVKPIILKGQPISSTRIRRLIRDKRLPKALEMLGHAYPITGEVIKGIGLGKKLGYPTANIDFKPRKLLPHDGVYSCRVEYDGKFYNGMMFVGNNHFDPDREKSVEVNIYNFRKSIHGKQLTCYPEVFIRENIVFKETSDLIKQLEKDKENVIELMNKGDDNNVS